MQMDNGRCALVYNGEIYNYLDLKEKLIHRGETFNSTGDTQVLIKLLVNYDIQILTQLNGMFAFGFWDEKEKTLLIARDRFGQKPIYYAWHEGLFLFASEVRALLASELFPRKADLNGVIGFLAYGAVIGPNTIIKNISLLPQGTGLKVNAVSRKVECSKWVSSLKSNQSSLLNLRQTFTKAVARHLIADVPVGLFLSGGTDSSAIAAAVSRATDNKIKSITVVFPDQEKISERFHAKRMANFSQTEHQEISITGKEIIGKLSSALLAMDQPTIDGINTYMVATAAQALNLKVVLSGLGGDEIFGGYPSFNDVPKMMVLRNRVKPILKPLNRLIQFTPIFFKKTGKLTDLFSSPGDLLSSYLIRRRLFSTRQIKELIPGINDEGWFPFISEIRFEYMQSLIQGREKPEAIALLEMDLYLGEMLLRDTDMMGMANSLEIRLPFLDLELMTYGLVDKNTFRLTKRIPKQNLVHAMGDWIPKENTHRKKMGFGFPFQHWMLNELREQLEAGNTYLQMWGQPFSGSGLDHLWKTFCKYPNQVGWARSWSLFILSRYLEAHKITI